MLTHTLSKLGRNLIGLTWDGDALWAGDWDSQTLLRLAADGSVEESFAAPGRPVGMTFRDGAITAVISDPENDDRSIHRFDLSRHKWSDESIRCPDDTGSHVSWDGRKLWLSQRYNKRVLQLGADGSVERAIEMPSEVVGIHWMGPTLWTNLRITKGASDIGRLDAGAEKPELVDHYDQGFVSLGYDGGGFWMSDLRGTTIARAAPPGL
ncbi:MAG TPA: hypothetical protein VGX02_06780 [Candidatus Eremiobacteraceae bacterium]|jgi:hypothetical protein|nr:hypothetical protein [Candidatus Eremiobacteraceae bacterium]